MLEVKLFPQSQNKIYEKQTYMRTSKFTTDHLLQSIVTLQVKYLDIVRFVENGSES
jgi:hypothetical protein